MEDSPVTRAEFDDLVKTVKKLKKGSKVEKDPNKPKKAPSEFNLFMGKEIKRIKAEDSTISHQDAFKKATQAWGAQKKKT